VVEEVKVVETSDSDQTIRKIVKSTLKRISSEDTPISLQALKKRIITRVTEKNSEISEKKAGKQLEEILMIKEVDGKITLEL
jgi:hypothetical protein